VNYNQI